MPQFTKFCGYVGIYAVNERTMKRMENGGRVGPCFGGAKENIAWEVNAYALYMGRKGHTMAGQPGPAGRKDGRMEGRK